MLDVLCNTGDRLQVTGGRFEKAEDSGYLGPLIIPRSDFRIKLNI